MNFALLFFITLVTVVVAQENVSQPTREEIKIRFNVDGCDDDGYFPLCGTGTIWKNVSSSCEIDTNTCPKALAAYDASKFSKSDWRTLILFIGTQHGWYGAWEYFWDIFETKDSELHAAYIEEQRRQYEEYIEEQRLRQDAFDVASSAAYDVADAAYAAYDVADAAYAATYNAADVALTINYDAASFAVTFELYTVAITAYAAAVNAAAYEAGVVSASAVLAAADAASSAKALADAYNAKNTTAISAAYAVATNATINTIAAAATNAALTIYVKMYC
jgi:hypothetical protein